MQYTVTVWFKDGTQETFTVVSEVRAEGGFLTLSWYSEDHPQTLWFEAGTVLKVKQRVE